MEPGAVIEGKYEILAKLREGGMGTIYKVRHRLLDEVRVVKVMQKHVVESAELRSRFIDEAKMATRLKHPNLGTIHDFALADDGTAYLVMEFIDGVTLRDLLVNQGLPPVLLSLEIAHQTLMALSYLHKKNIVHRDIAPDNLMLMHDEEGQPHIKVIDLGIAKTLDRQSGLTSTGVFLGKLSYASPEMFGSLDQGERLDGRSDLYSLGVVLYELLTGHKPISADGPARLLRAHLIDPPMAFEQSDPENRVPAEVRAVILKALEKRRGNRYASADEFDGDVVKLIRMFSSAEDHEGTKKIISGIHAIPASGGMGTPTPSAQDRLNRQFGVATPTSPPSDLDPTVRTEDMDLADAGEGRTARPTGKTGAGAGSSAPKVSRGGAKKASPIAMGLGVAAAVAIGAGGLVLFRRDAPKSPATDPSIVPTATSSSVGATPPATSPGTAASPSLPTPAPTPESKVEPTPAAATAEPTKPSAEAKASAESARSRMLKARQGAEREKAGELAPVAFRYGNEKSREAQDLFSQRQYDAARAAFDASARFFSDAENDARAEAARRKAAADRLAALPPPTHAPPPTIEPARPTPTAVAVVSMAPPAAPTAAPVVPPTPTDDARIRQTLKRYQQVQIAVDADGYVALYPALAPRRTEIAKAFSEMRSQELDIEILDIQIKGPKDAVVRCTERRIINPRVGSPNTVPARQAVIELEKRGDTWIIKNMR